MKEKILIVDAYNMIGNWPELARLKKSDRLEDARDQLLLILSDYHKQSDSKIIVVFDAMYVPGLSKAINNTAWMLFGLMKVRRLTAILKHWPENCSRG